MRKTAAPATALEGEAFDALYRECASDVHRYAHSLLGDRAGAEDVTALAFERLYRSRSRLDASRGTPRALLFTIARNAALDELRRRGRRREGEHPPEGHADPGSEAGLAAVEQRAELRRALAELSPREREVVLLKFHGGLTNVELARVLGVSESNAGTRMHRALGRLRALLEADQRRAA